MRKLVRYWLLGVMLLIAAADTSFALTNLYCDVSGCQVDFAETCNSLSAPLNYSQLQGCTTTGHVLKWNAGWQCSPDDTGPAYSGGTGISILGSQISVSSEVPLLNAASQTFTGTNTFSTPIQGSISGNAASITGSIAESQVTNLTTDLAAKAAAGANSDITSISGLTTSLSIAQGGTGSKTQNFVDLSSGQTIAGAKTFSSPPSSSQFISSAATGTSPLQVSSTTMVNNLNANMVGGKTLADLDNRYGVPLPPAVVRGRTTLRTLDSTGAAVGFYTSITVGADGFPVISYYDATNNDLKVAKCGDASCTPASATLRTLDSTGAAVGAYSSITIGTDGFPVISYYVYANGDLKVAKCGDASCTPASATIRTLDSTGDVGQYTSITIGTDGFPVISYYDYTNGDLKVAKCGDASCTPASATIRTLDSTGDVGQYTSITIGTDGFPVISYYDYTNGDLKVARCGDASCNPASANIRTLDSTGDVGYFTSITIGSDGFPVISYWDATNNDLKVAGCGDASCSNSVAAPVTLRTLDSTGDVGLSSSIAIGTDGFPVISYYDSTNGHLKVAKCGDASCTPASATIRTVDSTGDAGQYTSITIGTDGFPVIAYFDFFNQCLKVAKCNNVYCATNWGIR